MKGATASLQSLRPACLCQTPSTEASCPREVEVLVFHILIMFRMQGVQCLDQCLEKRGTQEVMQFSDDWMLYPCQISDIMILYDFICGPLWPVQCGRHCQ